jgi:hypothetical protein
LLGIAFAATAFAAKPLLLVELFLPEPVFTLAMVIEQKYVI